MSINNVKYDNKSRNWKGLLEGLMVLGTFMVIAAEPIGYILYIIRMIVLGTSDYGLLNDLALNDEVFIRFFGFLILAMYFVGGLISDNSENSSFINPNMPEEVGVKKTKGLFERVVYDVIILICITLGVCTLYFGYTKV